MSPTTRDTGREGRAGQGACAGCHSHTQRSRTAPCPRSPAEGSSRAHLVVLELAVRLPGQQRPRGVHDQAQVAVRAGVSQAHEVVNRHRRGDTRQGRRKSAELELSSSSRGTPPPCWIRTAQLASTEMPLFPTVQTSCDNATVFQAPLFCSRFPARSPLSAALTLHLRLLRSALAVAPPRPEAHLRPPEPAQ